VNALIHHYGSWALAPFGLAGMWMAGKRNRWGWALSLCTQALWATYAIITTQYGFLIGTFAYAGVYLRNFLRKPEPTIELCGNTVVGDPDYPCILKAGHRSSLFADDYHDHVDINGETW
jgi:hypothetical protein